MESFVAGIGVCSRPGVTDTALKYDTRRASHRPEINGLRAIAVMSVILYHAGGPFARALPGGFLGVDIFFVISGFLITGILMREGSSGRVSLVAFYERRARRILPALAVVSLAAIPPAWILLSPDQMQDFGLSLLAQTVLLSNLYFWLTAGYFAPSSETVPMIHTWSLAVEEQFYLFFPLVFLLLWRRGLAGPGLAVACLLGLALAEWMARNWGTAAFYLLPARMWELLAGAVAGFCAARFGLPEGQNGPAAWRFLGRHGGLAAGVGLLGIALALMFYDATLPIPGLWLLLPVSATTFVLICGAAPGPARALLTLRPMVGIGLISYSAYLLHQPVFAFIRLAQLEPPSAPVMAGGSLAVLALAWVCWRFVEEPFRTRRVGLRPLVLGLVATSGGVSAFGMLSMTSAGYQEARFSPSTIEVYRTVEASPARSRCHNRPPDRACIFPANRAPRWIILGDSHAVELAYGLGELARGQGESVLQLTQTGCPVALDYSVRDVRCAPWIWAALNRLVALDEPATIFMAYRHPLYLHGLNEENYPEILDAPDLIVDGSGIAEKQALYWASLRKSVEWLRAAGHKVVLVQPVPEIARHVDRLILHADRNGREMGQGDRSTVISVSRAYYEARSGHARRGLAEIAGEDPGVVLVDPVDTFCDARNCYAVRGGVSLYFDDDHPSLTAVAAILSGASEILGLPQGQIGSMIDRPAAGRARD